MKDILIKVDNFITKCEEWMIIFGVISATLIITLNVVLRYVFNASFFFAEEFVRYITIWVTFFGASACIRHNVHVRIEVILSRLSLKSAKILLCVIYILCIAGSVFILQTGLEYIRLLVASHQMNTAVRWLPMWVPNVCVPIFGVLAVKDFVQLLVLNLIRKGEIIYAIGEGKS